MPELIIRITVSDNYNVGLPGRSPVLAALCWVEWVFSCLEESSHGSHRQVKVQLFRTRALPHDKASCVCCIYTAQYCSHKGPMMPKAQHLLLAD